MATNNTYTNTTSASQSPIFKKTNTAVLEALKSFTEEYGWDDDTPDTRIIPSANEMRLIVDVQYEVGAGMMDEGGYEMQATSRPTVSGTFSAVQMNARYSFTTKFDDGWNNGQGKQGQVENQVVYQALKKMQAVQELYGQQFYGFSTGTVAVVAATGGSSATQTNIQLKDPFGTTLIGSTSANQLAYLSGLFRPGNGVALVRTGSLVEFGIVQGPGTSGDGYLDVTFTSAITPTAGDLIVFANAVTGTTLAETDYNKWMLGLLDIANSASVHGIATSSYANWAAYLDSTGGRWSYAKQQKMADQLMNNGGATLDRMVMSQGVYRDVVAGEGTALRYADGDGFDFDWSFRRKNTQLLSSRLTPPGCVWGFDRTAIGKKNVSDRPAAKGGPDIFSIDKVQDKGAFAASLNYVMFRTCQNRAGVGQATGLTEQ